MSSSQTLYRLVLFLFIIGLDVDFALLKRNLKPSVAVSTAGLVIPFGLGCAVSVGLYNEFISDDVKFTTFMCFIGTSSASLGSTHTQETGR